MEEKLVEIKGLVKNFPIRGGFFGREKARVHAVRGVDLSISKGETLGVVGESGCGKSTLAMLLLRLIDPDAGSIVFEGRDITDLSQSKLRPLRRHMQVVFQDPYSSLNPRMKIGKIVEEPIAIHEKISRAERAEKVAMLLDLVGLGKPDAEKYPHEFSGGQRQRIGIARAIALRPKIVIADEPVSALDVSIRGEILNLLADLRDKFSLSYLFISHDLQVIRHVSDRVAVMYLGKVVEMLEAKNITSALHPYTQALLSSAPVPDPTAQRRRRVLTGDVPSPVNPPRGCGFHTRCPFARDLCRKEEPLLISRGNLSACACHFADEIEKLGK